MTYNSNPGFTVFAREHTYVCCQKVISSKTSNNSKTEYLCHKIIIIIIGTTTNNKMDKKYKKYIYTLVSVYLVVRMDGYTYLLRQFLDFGFFHTIRKFCFHIHYIAFALN